MLFHEFGDPSKPIIMLFPGTMCHWKANFEKVIPRLLSDFFVLVVSYTGFDGEDREDFQSILAEVQKIEEMIQQNYQGKIFAAYGSSLGGTLVAQLVARKKVIMSKAIIGSSDFDQENHLLAFLKGKLLVMLMHPFLKNGYFVPKCVQSYFQKESSKNLYVRNIFSFMTGLTFVSKQSLFNQFYSDLITPLSNMIENDETEVHIFYAEKMGEKYLKRYKKHFKNPIIHRQNFRHEELLASYPEKWYQSVMAICNI